jgi:serine/threonine-protein kinase
VAITDAYVLPEDLIIMPVSELDAEIRARVHWEEGDFAVTRPRARTPTKIVDAQLGELLRRFSSARPIVDVIVEFSSANGVEPERLLLDAFPLLQRFIDNGLLVEESSPRAKKILPTLDPGDRVGSWEIVLCRQVLDDVELYQVRSSDKRLGALKIARRESEKIERAIDHERDVLDQLGGSCSPALIESGRYHDRSYLVMEWCAGVDAATVATELRGSPAREDRERLLRLCRDIASAYAELHDRGVLHGDVHERNILVDSRGRVRLLDFGLGRLMTADRGRGRERRAGFSIYVEPEYAVVHLAGRHAPPCTAAGEQYSIASLLYTLYTGTTCISFSADLKEAWRQTAESPVLSFVERGLPPFPVLERVLRCSLEKSAEDRFGSVRDLANALEAVASSASTLEFPSTASVPPNETVSLELLDAILREVSWDGSVFRRGLINAPVASVNFGSAGLGFMLYRLALLRNDADLLALAGVWATRACNSIGRRSAYYSPRMGLTRDVIGPVSLYHTASGIHLVRALIARAMGDLVSMRESARAFVRAAARRSDLADLTLGRSGLLLGSALLLEAMPEHPLLDRRPVLALGSRLADALWREAASLPPIGSQSGLVSLGIAHGWGGLLYAQLRWRAAAGSPLPPALETRLRELAECAEPYGRGLRWPWRDAHRRGKDTYMAGWCNGSGGLAQLWLLAASVYREAGFEELARGAAWNAWEDDNEHALDLCCGLSGRAYSLLAMYRHTGEFDWLRRARMLAASVAALESDASEVLHDGGTSLYKGRLGAALLSAEIERPESARMPLFEPEGWPAVSLDFSSARSEA